jgi:DNA polymerase I
VIQISPNHIITGRLVEIEKAVEPIIAQLNQTGLAIDIGIVEKIRSQNLERQKEWSEKIFSIAGNKFDIGKRDDIEKVLQQEGFRVGKRINKLVMDDLSRKGSNLSALIKEYRQIQRIASNGQSLINYYDSFFGKLKPIWHQNKALTGRILSEAPCVSNISKPYRTAVREDGYDFIYFDFRNFELRIQASLAEDPTLIEMFNNNFDLHGYTASLILGKEPPEITEAERKKFKSISLGYWYGMGTDGIVYRTGLNSKFVKMITEKLNQKFMVLRSRISSLEKEAKNLGYVETPWGRRMHKKADYGYWALLAQATAADYFKYILAQIANSFPDLILIAPLFDGGLFKLKKDQFDVERMIGGLNEICTQPIDTFCKMGIDVGFAETWMGAIQKNISTDSQQFKIKV